MLGYIFLQYYGKLLPLRTLVVFFLNKGTVIPATDLSEQVRTSKGIDIYMFVERTVLLRLQTSGLHETSQAARFLSICLQGR